MRMKHKIWLELNAEEATEEGAIPIATSIKLIQELLKVAKKYKFDARMKAIPKEIINYIPSGKIIKIEMLSDIIEKLSSEQFEFFINDLRKWVEHGRQIKAMKDDPEQVQKIGNSMGCSIMTEQNWNYFKEGMQWLDDGANKVKTNIEVIS